MPYYFDRHNATATTLLLCAKHDLISDSPQVSLRLGRTLDADNIRTGHDVYFECDVKANPSPLRLEWLRKVLPAMMVLFYFFIKNAFPGSTS